MTENNASAALLTTPLTMALTMALTRALTKALFRFSGVSDGGDIIG